MDSVGHALALHVGGDLEVLEVVVGEVDDIASGGGAQIAQGIGHGGVAKRMGDGLSADPAAEKAQNGEE